MNEPAPSRASFVAQLRMLVSCSAALLAIGLAGFMIFMSLKSFGTLNDFPQYHAAARMIASGRAAQVYDTAALLATERALHPDLQRPVALFVPPPAALLFVPIALFPPAAAFAVWMLSLVSALAASLYLIKRQMHIPAVGVGWLVAVVVSLGPTFESLRIAQPATLMLLALLAACELNRRGKPFLSGICLGMLLLKPQELLPLGLFFLAARQWRLLGGLVAVTAALTLISLAVFGIQGYQNYIALILDPQSAEFMQSSINPTVRGQCALLFGIDAPVTKVAALTGLALALAACVAAGIKARRADVFYVAFTVALPVGLVTDWHCHDYDLILLIPGLVATFLAASGSKTTAWMSLVIMLGTLPFMIPLYLPLHYFYLLRGGLVNPYFILLVVYAAAVLVAFFAAGKTFGKIPPESASL